MKYRIINLCAAQSSKAVLQRHSRSRRCISLVLFLGMLIAGFGLAGAEPLTVQIALEDTAMAGVEVPVSVTVNAKISAEGITLPEISGAKRLTGIVSQRFASSYDSRRGSSTSTTMSFIILPERAGELVIPPVKVRAGSRSGQSEPYRFKVLPAGAPVTTAEGQVLGSPVGTMEIFPARKLYVGETATMVLHLVIPGKMRVNSASAPEVTGLSDVSFVTRRNGNNQQETFRFSQPRSGKNGTVQFDGSAEFRILGAGKFTPSAAMTLAVVVPQKKRNSFFDDDDFFGAFSSVRTTPRKVIFPCQTPLEVLPLPPPPQGAFDTGLVGAWRINCRLNRNEGKSGEPVELILNASGSGGSENFRAPKLDFPGFRIYPPEVRRKEGSVSARYVMIPLVPGNPPLKFSVAAFNAEKGHYEVTSCDLALLVKPGNAVLPPLKAATEQKEPALSAPPIPRDNLNYQKQGNGKLVAVPLIINSIMPILLLTAAAVLLLLGNWLLPRLRGKDEKQLARRILRQKLADLRRELKKGGDPAEIFRKHGISAVAEALGLPPGATASEIAGKCGDDAEVARFFAALDASAFVPGGAKNTVSDADSSRRALLKMIARIMPLLLLLAAPSLKAEELNAAFNRADYEAAISRYQAELAKNSAALSPDLLYNLGNACYRAGDLPRARAALERAKLLSPRDGEIRANCDFVRAALQLPGETGRIAALRDRFRPDEYLVIAAAAIALLALLVVLRKKIPLPVLSALTGIALLLFILALCAATAQSQSSYSPARAVLMGKSVELRALPVLNGSVVSRLAGGSDAQIIEKRGSWVRLRAGDSDGWVPKENVEELFPYGIL